MSWNFNTIGDWVNNMISKSFVVTKNLSLKPYNVTSIDYQKFLVKHIAVCKGMSVLVCHHNIQGIYSIAHTTCKGVIACAYHIHGDHFVSCQPNVVAALAFGEQHTKGDIAFH